MLEEEKKTIDCLLVGKVRLRGFYELKLELEEVFGEKSWEIGGGMVEARIGEKVWRGRFGVT